MSDLEPADPERCQAMPNQLGHSFMSLGPRPKPVRCPNVPVFIAVEVVAGRDGLCGSMSLCLHCSELMLSDKDMRSRVQLQVIHRGDES